jgi:hypothetical protein
MSRSRGVGAAFDCRLGYPDAAEFDVRVASSGQVVTAIGITRICPGSIGSAPRMKIKEPKPVTPPSFVVFPAGDRLRVRDGSSEAEERGVRRSAN